MKKAVWGWFLTICGMFCVMGFTPDGTPPDLSSPKATVRSFVEALNHKDMKVMRMCVQGATDSASLEALFSEGFSISGIEVKSLIAEVDNATARVGAEYTLTIPGSLAQGGQPIKVTAADIVAVEKHGDNWLIVPDAEVQRAFEQFGDTSSTVQIGLRPLTTFAAIVAAPKAVMQAMEAARQRAKATSCLSNAKQLALGVMMYTQDYDEVFPRKNAPYKDLIWPYVKNNDVFTCPLDVKGTISYTFNPNIQGATIGSIAEPANTVLLYEGKNMQLDYRHDGKAVVAFTDGHAKLMGPEGAKGLFWYAAGAKPAPPTTTKKPGVKPSKKKR